MSELIHNSANRPPASFARVSVHFLDIIDIDDDQCVFGPGLTHSYEVVPNSLVVVSRVAYQNNTSKYFINNKSSSASEVTTLLKQRGIDLDNNRFLILQGEVEQISLMKPKVVRARGAERRSARTRARRAFWSTWRTSSGLRSTFRSSRPKRWRWTSSTIPAGRF